MSHNSHKIPQLTVIKAITIISSKWLKHKARNDSVRSDDIEYYLNHKDCQV